MDERIVTPRRRRKDDSFKIKGTVMVPRPTMNPTKIEQPLWRPREGKF